MSTHILGKNLFTQIRKVFAAPIFEDRAQSRVAHWANLLIWMNISVIVVLIFSLTFSRFPAEIITKLVIVDSITLLILLIPAILLRRRHLVATAWMLLLIFYVGLLYANLVIFQTVRTPIVIGYVLLIPMAGALLGRKTMYLFVVLVCIALFTIFTLEGLGVLKPVFSDHVLLIDLATPLAAMGVYMVFLASLIRDIEDRTMEERRFAIAYAKSNLELTNAQAELKQRGDDLEQRVIERTFELEQAIEHLRLEKELAEAATRVKTEFLANMSHELRTPMNGVIGMTSLLATTPLDEEQQILLDTVRQSSDALMVILNNLLDISKAESGKLGLDQRPFSVRFIVEESLELLSQKAAEKGLRLTHFIEESTPRTIVGDALRLRQILVNLTSNAVKFTAQGSVHVNVSYQQVDATTCRLHFAISDTGIGVDPAKLASLFEPFSQVDNSNTRRYDGIGLGLTICKRLCELMGGEIWVESQPGAGSTFHFTIVAPLSVMDTQAQEEPPAKFAFAPPAAQVTPQITPSPPSPKAIQPATSERVAPHSLRVLLVEDNLVNQKVALRMLSRLGYEADHAANGVEAVDAVRSQPYDVIFMDVQMPEMDGLEATRCIRQDQTLMRRPYIIAMTAAALELDKQKCLEAGMDDFLPKPARLEDIAEALQRRETS